MSSRDLAIVQPPKGAAGHYRFTLRRNGKKPWPQLQWRHQDRRITLRMPQATSLKDSLAAFETRVPWFETYVSRQRLRQSACLPLHGQETLVVHSPDFAAKPTLLDGQLQVGSAPLATMQRRIAAFIADQTLETMTHWVAAKTALLGAQPAKIRLSHAMRKWGACDRHNNLDFSWRLAMAPPKVQEYLAAHEVAHFKHRHHQDVFWAEVSHLMPDWAEPEHWLSFKGGQLMAFRPEQILPLQGPSNQPVML